MKRVVYALSILMALFITSPSATALIPLNKYDKIVSCDEQEYTYVVWKLNSGTPFRVEYTHHRGTPMNIYVMDATSFRNFSNGDRFDVYIAGSRSSVTSSFSSGWMKIPYEGDLFIVAQATNVQDGNWTTASGRLKFDIQLF